MKVAFLTSSGMLYGSNRSLVDLIDGLSGFAVEPYVILPKVDEMAVALTKRSIPMAVIPIQNWVSGYRHSSGSPIQQAFRYAKGRGAALSRLVKNVEILSSLINQLRLWNVDIIYTNSSVTPVGVMAAMLIGRPHIWHIREFVNSLDSGLRADWGMKLYKYFIARSDAQIAISEAIRDYYLGGMNVGRTHVIYNGVATLAQFDQCKMIASQKTYPSASKRYTFSILGRISPNKGQATAVEAVALLSKSHPCVRLLIVGGGKSDSIEELASKLGVAGNIEFWGYTDDPYQAYFSSDAVLVCSKSEGMGRVAAEAMSVCLPVIGLDRTATPEIVKHGHTGLLFDGGAGELADCMRQFIENPAWARKLGVNGWHVAREKYNSELYAQRIYEVLDKAVSGQ